MSIFKNQNETAYVGGRKHWTDVIKNTGSGELLLWRQPEEDFNTNSTLIVMPGEEAIFIKGGNIEATFPQGSYQLSTSNYPFISRLRNMLSGGVSVFNCVVYFVRTAHSRELLWGTDSPIQVRDKVHGVRTEIRARGSYKVQIANPGIFLTKCIGNNIPFQEQQELDRYFANEFQSTVKSSLSRAVNSMECELIGLDQQLDVLSRSIEPLMDEILSAYGLKCARFVVSGMDVDTQKYDELDAFTIAKTGKVMGSVGDKQVMQILGEDWGRQKAADILTNVSNNPGSGGFAAAGAGMGMGMAAGSVFSGMAQQMFAPMNAPSQPTPLAGPSGRFTQQPAQASQQPAAEEPLERLNKLQRLLDAQVITQEEFAEKRAEIIRNL